MNFMDMCYQQFTIASQCRDLSKDVENYNKADYYLTNFWFIDRREIEDFIVESRRDNPIYEAICRVLESISSNLPTRSLQELAPQELYDELQATLANLFLKCVHDSIKLQNNLNEQQSSNLATRLVKGDTTIFAEYKCQ